ncbi:MAG TPA: hypothetical protein VIK54_16150, partial [Acidimicrobiia bacterium]
MTDLQLVARARGVDIPADASHDEIVARLQSQATHPSRRTAPDSPDSEATPVAPPKLSERSGWWTSMSVAELR